MHEQRCEALPITRSIMLELRVRSITNEAAGINAYELVDPAGDDLPEFSAGSHIDVHIPGNFVRQYSLSNDPRERKRYVIGVLNVSDGRGGSAALHACVRAGHLLKVSAPRNNFPLAQDARRHLLIAGGIGITPMMAMISHLQCVGAEYKLHYCTRSPERTAFRDQVSPMVAAGRAVHHYDHGDPSQGVSLANLLHPWEEGTHLYYCGPPGMMAAVAKAASHWPEGTVHCEYFAAPPASWPRKENPVTDGAFQVRIASTGQTLDVPADKSIVQTLRDAGISCETSCEAGVCGTCRTRYLEGTPEHCDFVLNEGERDQYLMICCSRSSSELLVLDL
jgi:vanillate O-demethylase ferredoxin subunit